MRNMYNLHLPDTCCCHEALGTTEHFNPRVRQLCIGIDAKNSLVLITQFNCAALGRHERSNSVIALVACRREVLGRAML